MPVVPNYSTVAARFGLADHYLLGILPKTEELNSYILLVDELQIPEDVHLVLLSTLDVPDKFQVLIVISKKIPLPPSARILNFNFPPLRGEKNFFYSAVCHLAAMPLKDVKPDHSIYMSLLGLLHNSNPFANFTNALPQLAHHVQPVQQPAQSKDFSSVVNSRNLKQALPIIQPKLTLNESALLRSLEKYKEKNALFQIPDGFEMIGVQHPVNDIKALPGDIYPLILIPRNFPPSSDYLSLGGTRPNNETQQLWADFQVVAKKCTNPSTPHALAMSYPFILVPNSQLGFSENELRLPIYIDNVKINQIANGKGEAIKIDIYRPALVRDPTKPISVPYDLMCIRPKNQVNKTVVQDGDKSRKFVVSEVDSTL